MCQNAHTNTVYAKQNQQQVLDKKNIKCKNNVKHKNINATDERMNVEPGNKMLNVLIQNPNQIRIFM